MRTSGPAFHHSRYEPGRELGRGAQGIVVCVRDRENPAVPLVAKVWQGQSFQAAALRGEFALLSRLRLSGLVRAHDLTRCEISGTPVLIESFVDGPEAREWLDELAEINRGPRLTLVLSTVAATLAHLHESGFLHGDLKPAHIRIASAHDTPLPTLLDLGASVSTARAPLLAVAFTPAFAAPELRAGAAPSIASDLYALGATMTTLVTGAPPVGRAKLRLFDVAPWLPPNIADLLDDLVAEHPRDRPQSAHEILHRLGANNIAPNRPSSAIGRDEELRMLRQAKPVPVRWLVGPSGSGKTHLLRELQTRMLLDGRNVRLVSFPVRGELLGRLIGYLRGTTTLPFAFDAQHAVKPVVILDDAHLAPDELLTALDGYRCRHDSVSLPVEFIVATRNAPTTANVMNLGPLDDHSFAFLCRQFEVRDAMKINELALASAKNPGWIVASFGAIPLERDTILERVKELSARACDFLAIFALSGGELPISVCHRCTLNVSRDADPMAELSAAALITRRLDTREIHYSLFSRGLARDLALALETPTRWQLAADAWLSELSIPTSVLLALGTAQSAQPRSVHLLERAAVQARAEGVRSLEVDALLGLVQNEEQRSIERLLRLERLLRDGQGTEHHARVLEWLRTAAQRSPALLPLVWRRHAEKLAREGKTLEAIEMAERARNAALVNRDHLQAALALATIGVAALYHADWEIAEKNFDQARKELHSIHRSDTEEAARLDHNFGVVALYRERVPDAIAAFERAVLAKRELGDRAGIRSCLLNLGLAFCKAKRFDEAEKALQESLELARSLGQTAGQGWCLVARADVCIRRGDPGKAREWLAEARQLEAALPKPVRADMTLLQAELAILSGDGRSATNLLDGIDPELRSSDALVDTRALVLLSRACLIQLPKDKHRAATLAVHAIRRARQGKLVEMENQAIQSLRQARSRPHLPPRIMMNPALIRFDSWPWLTTLATGLSFNEAASSLAQLILPVAGAERLFFSWIDAGGKTMEAVGFDLDGLPIALPMQRIPTEIVGEALRTPYPILHVGESSRLAIAGPKRQTDGSRALVILEHRFAPSAFDHLPTEVVHQWGILAGLLFSLGKSPETTTSQERPAESSRPSSGNWAEPPRPHPGQTTYVPALERRRSIPSIIGHSLALEKALVRLEAGIESELPILIFGETGTGKELFARAIHDYGRRGNEPFVAVNCAAIPDSLFEAELFGHVRGSFTGAERNRAGLLARAARGTLFLDEIGELPLLRQASLLRVLQDRTYRPVGSDEEIPFDVRIVAATNRDLDRAVDTGTFRRDLLYRLNTLEIHVPALRDRRADIRGLAHLFLQRAGSKASLSEEAIATLEAYAWPGNVRELEHVMQRLALQPVEVIERSFLPREIRSSAPNSMPSTPRGSRAKTEAAARLEVEEALHRCHGNISHAATLLGLTRHGLKKRMVRLGLRAPSPGTTKEA
jgi:serine/threonine-protein kinase PknK